MILPTANSAVVPLVRFSPTSHASALKYEDERRRHRGRREAGVRRGAAARGSAEASRRRSSDFARDSAREILPPKATPRCVGFGNASSNLSEVLRDVRVERRHAPPGGDRTRTVPSPRRRYDPHRTRVRGGALEGSRRSIGPWPSPAREPSPDRASGGVVASTRRPRGRPVTRVLDGPLLTRGQRDVGHDHDEVERAFHHMQRCLVEELGRSSGAASVSGSGSAQSTRQDASVAATSSSTPSRAIRSANDRNGFDVRRR